MATKKTKFQKQLAASHKEIKDKRATIFSKSAEKSMRRVKEAEEDKLDKLQIQRLDLEDMHPNSTVTLKVTKDGFDSDAWAKALVDVDIKIIIQERKVKAAQDAYDEWFNVG